MRRLVTSLCSVLLAILAAEAAMKSSIVTTTPRPNPSSMSTTLPVNKTSGNSTSLQTVQQTFNLLDEGEQYMHLAEGKDIILVMGNTGAGKSTFALFMATDNAKLISVQKSEGKFLIEDGNAKISTSTIDSKTIYPELIANVTSNLYFVDCPGFSDTRNASYDIAATFLIHRVVEKAANVKIIFAANYASLSSGGDRRDFMTLLKHATNFIKNIPKYNNSIGLVVTKVDNIFVKKNRVHALVSDEDMKSGIANFLEEVKASIRTRQMKEDQKAEFHALALQLIDIFLLKSGENYDNFELFRRPDEPGPLSNITLLRKGKKRLEHLVHASTVYIPKVSNDFGYTISADSKVEIYRLVDGINDQVASDVMNIVQQIKTHFRNKELESPRDAWQLQKQFTKDFMFIQTVLNGTADSIKDLLGKLRAIVETANVMKSAEPLKRIAKNEKYLDFLQIVSDEALRVRPSDWVEPINSILENIRFSKNAYDYLVKLHERLSWYEIQQDKSKYNVADLNDWGKLNRPQGIHITANNLEQFMNIIFDKLYVEYHENKEEFYVDIFKMSILNGLLDVSLNKETQIRLEGTTLVSKGVYVKLKDVSTKFLTMRSQIKSIEIYAQHTVFIDADLIAKGIDVSILASKWDVVGTRKIILDGQDGASTAKATSGLPGTGTNGYSGSTGHWGENAGTFFGLGKQFVNGISLTISANGGKGGQGQEGGDGASGVNGETYDFLFHLAPIESVQPPIFCARYTARFPNGRCSLVDDFPVKWQYFLYYNHTYAYIYNLYGSPGGNGGNGGSGGPGGPGGRRGSVRVVALEDKSDIILTSNKGQPGIGGFGGQGGKSGKDGCKYGLQGSIWYISHTLWDDTYIHYYVTSTDCNLSSGGSGSNGANNNALVSPDNAMPYKNTLLPIITYKSHLREHLNTDFQTLHISQMITTIEESTVIASLYNIPSIIHDIQSLEEHYYRLHSNFNFQHSYQTLSNMTISFVEKLPKGESSLENRKVLNYLYIATLSKISSLKNVAVGFHIIDIKAYLDLAITNINSWQDMTLKETIHQHNHDYQRNVDRKISSANEFIETEITVEFQNINNKIEEQIDRLLSEVKAQKEDAEKNKADLEKKRREVKRALQMQKMFGFLKIFSSTLSFLGPWGAAVGELIGTTTNIAGSLTMNRNAGEIRRTVLPQGVKSLKLIAEASVNAIRDRRITALSKKLEALNEEMKKYPDQLGGVDDVKEVSNITFLFNTAKSAKEVDLKQIAALEEDLNKHITKKSSELKQHTSPTGTIRQNALKAIEHINIVSNVADVAVDVYNKYKDDEEQLKEINAALDAEQDAINKLKQYEQDIYHVMKPLISDLSDDMKQLEGELGGKSQVGLDVAKWQIQTKIRDMKLQMQQFTRGYELEEDMARCFEKLDEAMSVLITVYDRIQDFQEQKNLADLITAVSSPEANVIKINDKEMSKAINKLELMIKSNIILSQYERAISSFKQFVFPFADSFLQEYFLPRDLQVGNSTQLLVDKAVRNIRSLRAKIGESGAVINNDKDTHIYEHDFNNRHNTTSSFHVWKSNSYQAEISSLLSGKTVALKADIRENTDINAVKFNLIQLHLKAENTTLQKSLDAALQFYKVSLTHLGNSYYRCDGRFYVIPSDSITITYSFKKSKGEPQTKNEVYNKLKKGDIFLSPYAMWRIQLVGKSYTRLKKFKRHVDVELEGHGTYVGKLAKVCDTNLERYYMVDDSLSHLTNTF